MQDFREADRCTTEMDRTYYPIFMVLKDIRNVLISILQEIKDKGLCRCRLFLHVHAGVFSRSHSMSC